MIINGVEWDKTFTPSFTPSEMLKMGVFGGLYLNSIAYKYPPSWFKDAKLSKDKSNPSLNYYGVGASMSLKDWQDHGWITEHDPRGWFEWYCNYYLGRRIPEEDKRQIGRWYRTVSRHSKEIDLNCKLEDKLCRPVQRQALLHWAWDSTSKPLYRMTDKDKNNLLKALKDKSLKEKDNSKYIISTRIIESFTLRPDEMILDIQECEVGSVYSMYKLNDNTAEFMHRIIIKESQELSSDYINECTILRTKKTYELYP